MNFVALDVETANSQLASICQIGIATYIDGQLAGEFLSLIDPQTEFDPINIELHGIDEDMVDGAPTFEEIFPEIASRIAGKIVVTHTPVDRTRLDRSVEMFGTHPLPDCTWLDSAKITRRTWLDRSHSGYGLAAVCEMLGHNFAHHDALEDAKAAAAVVFAAIDQTGIPLTDWIELCKKPIKPSNRHSQEVANPDANPDGPFFGETVVFTGSLKMSRHVAKKRAADLGCQPASTVTRKTTMLVVGTQDLTLLAGHNKSSKHRRAEELIKKGHGIRILSEDDFNAFLPKAD